MSSSIINSIFPSLIFNDFSLSSDNNSGFSNKFGLKDNIYSICGYTVKIQDYLFEGIKVKFNLKGKYTKEIEVQNAKIKILVLKDENGNEAHNLDAGTDVLINNLEIDFFKEDASLFNLKSSNSHISLINQANLNLMLPSCKLFYQGNRIVKSSDLQILLNNENSSFSFSSNNAYLQLPIETSLFLFPLLYSIINNQSTTFSFNKVEIFINKDTKAIITDFCYKIESNGEFNLTFPECELFLSFFKFHLYDFKLNNKSISIRNIDMDNAKCSIHPLSENEDPIIQGTISDDHSIKINIMPIEANFSLSRFHKFTKLILQNSFWHFLMNLQNFQKFTIEFKDILLNIQISEEHTIHFRFNLIYTNQVDSILISSSKISFHINNGSEIIKGQTFQFSQKQEINKETNEPTTITDIFLSQLKYDFSIDEVFPFLKFLKKMSNSIIDIFFKGNITINISSIQFLIGQTIKGSNDHSQFVDIFLLTQPIQINPVDERFILNFAINFSVKYFNNLTKFWDSIIEPFNAQLIIKFNKFKRHFTALIEEEISVNLTSRFLSSLINNLKNPIVERTPNYFISNYTNETISISMQESNAPMNIEPMSSQSLFSDIFYLNIDDKSIKFSASTITSRIFIRNYLFIDVELKDGTKNIYFMNTLSVENQLGIDLRILYKDKHSFSTLMTINHKQRRGFTKPADFQNPFAAVPAVSENILPSSPGGIFRKEQYQSFTLKKYKSVAYIIKGIKPDLDADCIVYCKSSSSDKSKTMLFLPRYKIENHLPFPVSFIFKHLKATSEIYVDSLNKKAVLMPYDINQQFEIIAKINDKEESKPLIVNLKLEPSNPQEYDLCFEKCRIPLTVTIGDNIPMIRFVLKCPTIVFNCSSSSFNVNNIILQKEKSYNLPLFESNGFPALFVPDQSEPEIEVPVTSYPETIHIFSPPFLDQSCIIMLKNKANDKLFTPVKVNIKRDLVKGNLIYLYDFIHVKNNTKRSINFILEQDSNKIRLKFEPGITSPILFTNEEKSFYIEIEGYKQSSKIYLSYPTNTVLRLFSDEKLNRRKKENELHIKISITENEEGQNEVELNDATFTTSPYIIVNDTDHILYAQQTNNWLPLRVSPRSSTIFAFDYPFQESFAVLTIEGKSVMLHFSDYFFKTKLSFRIANEFLNLNMITNKHNQRIICISDHNDEVVYDHFLSILIDSVRLSLITYDQHQLLTLIAKKFNLTGKSEGGLFDITNSIKSIQVYDDTGKLSQGIILNGNDKSNFLNIDAFTSSTSKYIKLSQLIGLSIEISPIDIQINSETFYYFRKFLIESNITNLHFIRNALNHQLINASIFVISPISVSLFIRKNVNETQQSDMHLFHILPIQTPSLMNFTLPSILINNISCTFESIADTISKVYSNLLTTFFCLAAGQQTYKETITYPYSFYENIDLSLTELKSKSKIDSLSEYESIYCSKDSDFENFSNQCQQENDKKINTIEIGKYNDDQQNESANTNTTNNNNSNRNDNQQKESADNSILNPAQTPLSVSPSSILSFFTMQTQTIPSRKDFHFIKDENQMNSVYNSKNLKIIEDHKVIQLNRIVPIDMNAYNNAITMSKKKKVPLLVQSLLSHNNYLLVFDDCIVVVDSEQVKFDIPFASILEFTNEKTIVKVSIKPEKPKLPPKIVDIIFNTNFDAETAMNEMTSRLMMEPNKKIINI